MLATPRETNSKEEQFMANRSRKPQNKNNKKGGKFNVPKSNYQDRFAESEKFKGKQGNCPIMNVKSSDNDARWYIPPEMEASDTMTIPETVMSGAPIIHHSSINTSGVVTNRRTTKVPGVAAYHVMSQLPSFPDMPVEAINQVGRNLYQSMQAKNSRNPIYGMPTVMMYLVAHADVLSYYEFLCRIYGTVKKFDTFDNYTPIVLLQAMGVDFDDIKMHLADFRNNINLLADAIRSLLIPSAFDYIDRKIFLYSNIYTDSNTPMAQYYMYVPEGFYVWVEGQGNDPVGNPGLTYLKFEDYWLPEGQLHNATSLIEYGWNMITPLRNSGDITWIAADFKKAFGAESMYHVQGIAETFQLDPVYNAEVLSQMENAFVYPPALQVSKTDNRILGAIVQDPGIQDGNLYATKVQQAFMAYQTSPVIAREVNVPESGNTIPFSQTIEDQTVILNFHHANVTPDEMLVASRFTASKPFVITNYDTPLGTITDAVSIQNPETTELILGCYYYQYDYNRSVVSDVMWSHEIVNNAPSVALGNSITTTQRHLSLWSKFDWSFKMYLSYFGTDEKIHSTDTVFDLDNYYLFDRFLLTQTNYRATLGLFSPRQLIGFATR